MNLTNYVRQVSLEDFGWEFRHQAFWNKRLRTTGGRFFPKDGHLDFNPKIYETFGLETFRKIVRHELVHYHLYHQRRVTAMEIEILKNYSSRWMACATLLHCLTRKPFLSMNEKPAAAISSWSRIIAISTIDFLSKLQYSIDI